MKKNIGTNLALYPTPLVVVGTMVDGKPNYTLVGHLGIIGHDRIMVSQLRNRRLPKERAGIYGKIRSNLS